MARHVIIGGGPAGIAAIEAIRATEGQASSLTLISDEPAYSRMVLPYYLAREIPEAHCLIGDQAYFDRQKVEPLLGVRVQRVDTQARNLILSDGKTVPFDTLLIATGSRCGTAHRSPGAGNRQVQQWQAHPLVKYRSDHQCGPCDCGHGYSPQYRLSCRFWCRAQWRRHGR